MNVSSRTYFFEKVVGGTWSWATGALEKSVCTLPALGSSPCSPDIYLDLSKQITGESTPGSAVLPMCTLRFVHFAQDREWL